MDGEDIRELDGGVPPVQSATWHGDVRCHWYACGGADHDAEDLAASVVLEESLQELLTMRSV